VSGSIMAGIIQGDQNAGRWRQQARIARMSFSE
jgi:hypothetical protein